MSMIRQVIITTSKLMEFFIVSNYFDSFSFSFLDSKMQEEYTHSNEITKPNYVSFILFIDVTGIGFG